LSPSRGFCSGLRWESRGIEADGPHEGIEIVRRGSTHGKLRQLPLIEAIIVNPSRRLSHSIFHAGLDS
jgi:hypothetical protein